MLHWYKIKASCWPPSIFTSIRQRQAIGYSTATYRSVISTTKHYNHLQNILKKRPVVLDGVENTSVTPQSQAHMVQLLQQQSNRPWYGAATFCTMVRDEPLHRKYTHPTSITVGAVRGWLQGQRQTQYQLQRRSPCHVNRSYWKGGCYWIKKVIYSRSHHVHII